MDSDVCGLIRRAYSSFIESEIHCRPGPRGQILVQTPFFTPDNDPIEVAVERIADGRIRLSDRRAAYEFLFLMGLEVTENDRRASIVNQITSNYEVDVERRELVVLVPEADLGSGLHRLVNAEQRLYDILLTAQPGPLERSFRVEVGEYLTQREVRYQPGVVLPGYSIRHRVDFLIPNGGIQLVDTLSASSRSDAQDAAIKTSFKWMDLKRTFERYVTVSVYDDSDPVWDNALPILRNNQSDRIYPWSDREGFLASITHH